MDSATLILLLALGNAILCISLFFFDFQNRKSLILSTWSWSKAAQALAWLLLFGRNLIPDFASILAGNLLLLAGIALEAGAMWEACEQPQWRKPLLSLLALCCIVFSGIYLLEIGHPAPGSAALRVASASIMVSVLYCIQAWAFLRHAASHHAPAGHQPVATATNSPLRRFIGISTALLALIIALRAALALPLGLTLLANNWLQGLTFVGMYVQMLINGFGFLLLAREQQEAELLRLALVDPLTNAPNRRGFFNALAPWLALARRPGNHTALIMLDLDHFKRINDNYGHPIGDQVLKSVVEISQSQLRDSDLIGRLGGEEFAVLLPRTNAVDAMMVAERMRSAIMAVQIKAEKVVLSVTASFGVTTIRPDDTMVSLIKRADEALYAAKHAGRNQVREAAPVAELVV